MVRRGHPLPIAILAALLAASPLTGERLVVRTYSVIEGLASDRVVCLVTDRDGFLWICTNGGLSRFDGSRFVTYGTAAGLPDPVVNHFLQTRSGSRWVAMNGGGVALLQPGEPGADGRIFTAFHVGSTPRSMRVNTMLEAQDGAVLAGTDGGLFRARHPGSEPRFELVPLGIPGFPDSGLQIWGMAQDGTGGIWVGTSGGLVLLHGDEPVAHVRIGPTQGADHVYDILPDAAGRLWLGHDTGLFIWNPPPRGGGSPRDGGALSLRAASCLGSTPLAGAPALDLPGSPDGVCHWDPGGERRGRSMVRSLRQADDGWIWLATGAGLGAFDGARLRLFGPDQGLPSSTLLRVSVDPGGDVWVGSQGGLHRVLRRGFTYYTAEDGLIGPGLRTMQRGHDGHLYVISTTSVIHRFDRDRWTAVRPNLPPTAGGVGRSIYGAALLDRTGAWWLGTGGGLVRFPAVARIEALADARPVATYTTEDGLAGDDIWQLFEDSRGDIWIATRIPGAEPLTRWERSTGRFQRFGAGEGLPAERAVRSFLEHPAGTLWASFWDGGLARFDGERFQFFAPDADVPGGHLYGLLVDRRGWLWVGGRQTFFSREPTATDPRFTSFQVDGQPLMAFALIEDRNGWIYAQTVTGLVRFQAEDGPLQQLGLGTPFSHAETRLHRDPDGTLWMVSDAAVVRYEPQPLRGGGPPTVRIGAVRVAGVPLAVPPLGATSMEAIRLGPAQRQIEFDFFALGLGADKPLRFQVRLHGADEGWGSPTTHGSVVYAGLGPGRYRFQVRAVSATGQVSAEPAMVAFVVQPPVWRSDWFLGLLAAALAGALVTAHRVRVRRLLELEQIRTRIAADLHDDLGSSLARVSLLAEASRRALLDAPETAERMLQEIGATSRELVAAAGDIAFSIDPGRGRLDGLMARVRRFTEDLLAGTGIDWRFEVAGETEGVVLSSDERRHLLAIVKEALHNAIRHGRPARMALALSLDGDVLGIEVRDDGLGFAADTSRLESVAGQGLRNMRQRANDLGASLEVVSRPGAGTRVSVRCRLRRPHRMAMR
jgi:signal transduction histidine kinase/ligand-binding sensor domain-containing protein